MLSVCLVSCPVCDFLFSDLFYKDFGQHWILLRTNQLCKNNPMVRRERKTHIMRNRVNRQSLLGCDDFNAHCIERLHADYHLVAVTKDRLWESDVIPLLLLLLGSSLIYLPDSSQETHITGLSFPRPKLDATHSSFGDNIHCALDQ